ncbi:hypothetical protein CAPTEDRAFT_226760 [Capitella teleta]|uniref:Uncharacterized protein n=1 Tax=Capitella teleta TaxID=283909 RepID=N1PB72_CAPTE|nr:hypothetical protein CAPTEDRAFT_226760 [Capitella teleta]|eukprot:ELU18851.1 hypothetical protein CAPTEDRAFT_226760 [Capitella teleta]
MPAHAAQSMGYSREQKQGLSLYGSDWLIVESAEHVRNFSKAFQCDFFRNGRTRAPAKERLCSDRTDHQLLRRGRTDLGVVFHIHAWNGYYSLALRAATALFRESSGLLVDGCDYKDTIDIYVVNSRSKRDAVSECEEACSTLNDTKLSSFTGVCIYDCITAQDPQIAAMTMQFQRTLSSIENEDRLLPLIPVIVVGAQNSDATTPCPALLLTLIFVLGSLHRWT